MWLVFALIHIFLLSLVNYIDEYLTRNNKIPKSANINKRIGGLLLVSMIFTFLGALVLGISLGDISLPSHALLLAIFSAIPMGIMFAVYFYLLTTYPVYQVLPLFQISSLWLLLMELVTGGSITFFGLMGVILLILGAYLLDTGAFKWQIPTKLLLLMIPSTLPWALALMMIRVASESGSTPVISFWQLIGMGTLGVILFLFVKTYREGFLFRIRKQGKNFLGFSILNEALSQGGYFFSNLSVAIAPVATYVSAISGVQSIFLLGLFFFFPQGKRTSITKIQAVAIFLIAIGIFLIEGVK